jgi:pimeloyl-ACP methyl ester carboxylesterase
VRFLRHFTVVAALILLAVTDVSAQVSAANTFRVFVRGAESGIEEVTLFELPQGWTLRGSVKMRAPISAAIDYWEARYDRNWRPLELTINVTEDSVRRTLHSTFNGAIASIDVSQNDQIERRTVTVAPDAVVLPGLVFGAYEALAARLSNSQRGASFPALIAENTVTITVNNVTPETIQVPGRTISARRWTLHLGGDGSKVNMNLEVWTEASRLLRIDMPSRMLSVLRDDIAGVSARVVSMARANDETVQIPANGFSLAATISRPAAATASTTPPGSKTAPARLPAVVLISGSSPTDRDEVVSGIPIFAELANVLADEGFLVVRYDERGVGQSGGRAETATLDEFALDARAVIASLSKRKDVDPKRISVIGYGEGGWIALIAAAREQRIAAITLVATPATSGSELVLEQQRAFLDRSGSAGTDRQSAIERQKAIIAAVITGKGWENITLDVRRRVDTPLYRSFLTFEPAQTIARVKQPMLVVHPALAREVGPHHGEQVAQFGRTRPRSPATEFMPVTGERPDAEAIPAVASWLKATLSPPSVK